MSQGCHERNILVPPGLALPSLGPQGTDGINLEGASSGPRISGGFIGGGGRHTISGLPFSPDLSEPLPLRLDPSQRVSEGHLQDGHVLRDEQQTKRQHPKAQDGQKTEDAS
jgi:hypothetical protein